MKKHVMFKGKTLGLFSAAAGFAVLLAAACSDFNPAYKLEGNLSARYTLTVNISPKNGGSVIRDPDTSDYAPDTRVRLTARPRAGYKFDRWAEFAGITDTAIRITMNGNQTVTAVFKADNDSGPVTPSARCTLTVAASPTTGGSVIRDPDSSDYAPDTRVRLTARPRAGYKFDRWAEFAGIIDTAITITTSGNQTVTAVFSLTDSATLPNTIDVPVTYYDFHSDRSNPEFEQPHGKGTRGGPGGGVGLWTDMVASTLDKDNKPQIGPTPYRNLGIAHWFRDWNTYLTGPYSKGENTAPVYNPTPNIRTQYNNEWDATVTVVDEVASVGHDTSFKNIVIPGELPFRLTNSTTRMYEYNSTSFFPLDNRGFGNEWASMSGAASHNYAFTMEMEYPFTVKDSMVLHFRGDDDAWVFIDKQLVLDLGGIHQPCSSSFVVTSIPNGKFEVGDNATLRMFFAERHSSDSNLRIQTNIIGP